MRTFPTKPSIALIAAVLSVVVLAGAGMASTRPRTVVVKADPGPIGWGFGLSSFDEKEQRLGQTFVAPRAATKLIAISVPVSASNEVVVIEIYKTGIEAPLGELLATVEYEGAPETDEFPWRRVAIKPRIVMEPDQRYSFVLRAKNPSDHLGTVANYDVYPGGEAYCYCPVVTEDNVYDGVRAWQSGIELDGRNSDLAFRLYLRKIAAPAPTS